MKKNIYQFRGWEGIDVDNATSLFEYGFLFNPKAKKNFCNIVYGIAINNKGNYNRFVYSSIDWDSILSQSWIDWEDVYKFAGTTKENYEKFSVHALSDLTSFYGFEEIFGTNYDFGFEVNE